MKDYLSIPMIRVLFRPSGARSLRAAERAPNGRTDAPKEWQAAGVWAYLVFPVVCSSAGHGVQSRLVGDCAGGNRSLARTCFYRLKTIPLYLATNLSRAGRPQPKSTTCHDKELYHGNGHRSRLRRRATRSRRRHAVLARHARDEPSWLAATRENSRRARRAAARLQSAANELR